MLDRNTRTGRAIQGSFGSAVAFQIDVDAWPSPPAGLFVVEERTIYLRSLDAMTVVHEYGHAIDCALGGRVYYSGTEPTIRKAFADALNFVTPYAATGVDEFFAECFRAWCGANYEASAWPGVSRERLRGLHPTMSSFSLSVLVTRHERAVRRGGRAGSDRNGTAALPKPRRARRGAARAPFPADGLRFSVDANGKRKRHSHRCKRCRCSVYCYIAKCALPQRVERCRWCW